MIANSYSYLVSKGYKKMLRVLSVVGGYFCRACI
jgi:hypothetical protein